MNKPLPHFTYHPDPLKTGAFQRREVICACCEEQRPFVYVAPVYGEEDLHERLCPWCISDGSAAEKLGASFADAHPLRKAGVPEAVVAEVHERTPAYVSWQQEEWLAHCGDACEFHGDASVEDVCNAGEKTKVAWFAHYGLSEKEWSQITKWYRPGGDQSFYKFICRQCGTVLLGWDCS